MKFHNGMKVTTTLVRKDGKWVSEDGGTTPGAELSDYQVDMAVNVAGTWHFVEEDDA